MANCLGMVQVQAIHVLRARGWSFRRIGRELGIHRDTVRRHVQLAESSVGEYLFEIIMRRYENRSTVMTSNRPIEDWGKLIGDVPSATAILDRFLHHAEVLTLTGKSYRLKGRAGKEQDGKTQPEEKT